MPKKNSQTLWLLVPFIDFIVCTLFLITFLFFSSPRGGPKSANPCKVERMYQVEISIHELFISWTRHLNLDNHFIPMSCQALSHSQSALLKLYFSLFSITLFLMYDNAEKLLTPPAKILKNERTIKCMNWIRSCPFRSSIEPRVPCPVPGCQVQIDQRSNGLRNHVLSVRSHVAMNGNGTQSQYDCLVYHENYAKWLILACKKMMHLYIFKTYPFANYRNILGHSKLENATIKIWKF